MGVLLLLTSPQRTLRAVGGGSAAGPSHSRTRADAGTCPLLVEAAKGRFRRSRSLTPSGPRTAFEGAGALAELSRERGDFLGATRAKPIMRIGGFRPRSTHGLSCRLLITDT